MSMSSDAIIYQFSDDGAHQQERFDLLDKAQSQAVCRFLKYTSAHPDFADATQAKKALDQFWGRFSE